MTEVTFDLSYGNTMHTCRKLHRAYLPWGPLNFPPEKTSKRCLKAFSQSGTRVAVELSVGWFPGFRNQVHFLDSLPNLSPAAVREMVFLDTPLALTPCGCTGPEFGSEQTLFGAHTSHWFPCREGSGGTSVMGPHVLFVPVPSCWARRKGSVEDINQLELQWLWWSWHWPEHTWGSLPSVLDWGEGGTEGCSQESRSCENPNVQLSVLGKEGPALVSDVPQDCQNTALVPNWGAHSHFTDHLPSS